MTRSTTASFRPTPNFRAVRRSALVHVQMFDAAGALQDVIVENVSSTGMRGTARLTPPGVNDVVRVHLPDQTTLWGLVRWVNGAKFGVEFDPMSRLQPVFPPLP